METLLARVHSMEWLAEGVLGLDLRPLDVQEWPPVTAGSHVDLQLPSGATRSYSLVNAPGETHRYVVAVHRDPNSRGGSRYIHEVARPGHQLAIAGPRNSFVLHEDASHSVFIAGGIGVTPLWCMAQRLSGMSGSWTMHYCARVREAAAYATELEALGVATGNAVHLHLDGGDPARRADLAAIVAAAPAGTHFYCCGPAPMIKAFEQATAHLAPEYVHREYFTPPVQAATPSAGSDHAFTVNLARSGRSLEVPATQSILDTLLAAGIHAPHSCMSGICRACETRVLEGKPDHRDMVLEPAERARSDVMMICCSRACAGPLTLDL